MEWVGAVTGGAIISAQRTATGASRGTWLVDVRAPGGEVRELVLRHDTGDGPLSGSELTMGREAKLLKALYAAGIRAPQVVAVSGDGNSTLVVRVPGTSDYSGLTDDQREAVMTDFFTELARVHSLDIGPLDVDFRRPATPAENPLVDLDLWEGHFKTFRRSASSMPLVAWAFAWLRRNAPTNAERTSVCHGDCGPGNFLHHQGKVSAILDWEFSHFGDPMDDLGWVVWRAASMGEAFLTRHFERYGALAGVTVDWRRIRYYEIFVQVRMAVACLGALERRSGNMNAAIYFNVAPALEARIVSLIAHYEGVDLPPIALPEGSQGTIESEVADTLISDLSQVIIPSLTDDVVNQRAGGDLTLLMHLRAVDQRGAGLEMAELASLASLLGARPSSLADGWATLGKLVADAAGARHQQLLAHFHQTAAFHAALWPGIGNIMRAAA